jgi:hypothetical protein
MAHRRRSRRLDRCHANGRNRREGVIEHDPDDSRLSTTHQRTSARTIAAFGEISGSPLHVGALGAPDGLEALEGLALVFEPEE